jgi:hypothetical protein
MPFEAQDKPALSVQNARQQDHSNKLPFLPVHGEGREAELF